MSEVKWSEVAHLYMGCQLEVPERYNFGGLMTELRVMQMIGIKDEYISFEEVYGFYHISNFKSILRPLEDMTEEERQELSFQSSNVLYGMFDDIYAQQSAAKATAYLLSKSFDLYGLISSGQAISKSESEK